MQLLHAYGYSTALFFCSPPTSFSAENSSILPILKPSLLLFSEDVLVLLYHLGKRREKGLELFRNSKVKVKAK